MSVALPVFHPIPNNYLPYYLLVVWWWHPRRMGNYKSYKYVCINIVIILNILITQNVTLLMLWTPWCHFSQKFFLINNYAEEAFTVQSNTINDRRNKYLTFVGSNNYRQGLNSISNRLRSVWNMIEKSWLSFAREMFKIKCKINIIQAGLLLLWITCVVYS